ncbi:YkgJ family cysteine cluster protein [Clostridium sp.]|uniref:YkgJ family cysteine cluster protein n=1 Tax=Clostridium sp. TaxID=1506 RepID=UPI001B68E1F3|nr:YkgJ family cysteine cluster protein [Clostridium sp.]MBP3914591.1 YkgJ family cysteine cluster protein [Clostridium sp.]
MSTKSSVSEFLQHQINGKVVDLKNPNCNNCNECCSLLSMITPEEYQFYLKYFSTDKKGREIFKQGVTRWVEISRKLNSFNMMCPFISKTKRCLIYQIRPKVCKEFHCSPSLNKLDKSSIENSEHFTIYDIVKAIVK